MLIEINNSYSQIKDYTQAEFNQIRELLSYNIKPHEAFFSRAYSTKRYLIDKKGFFPTGLLFLLKELPNCKFKDLRKQPIFKSFLAYKGSLTPYLDQKQAIMAAIDFEHGTLSLPTGSGKSLVIALLIAYYGLPTLVVVPTLEIKRQLEDFFKNCFFDTSLITVENIASTKLKKASNYDVLILDEAHHAAAKTYRELNKKVWNNIYYRFCLTATPYRNNDDEMLLFQSIAGKVIYQLSIINSIKKNYIVPVDAYYFEVPKIENDYYTYQEVYKNLVVENEARNQIIAQLVEKIKDKSTLVLVKEIKHGQNLQKLLNIPFANGEDENTANLIKDFNSGKIKQLIGTTGVLGEGIDTKPAEYIVIAGLGKAKTNFLQCVGRGVRVYPGKESCKVVLFRDRSHRFTLRHYNAQVKILKDEFKVKPIKL